MKALTPGQFELLKKKFLSHIRSLNITGEQVAEHIVIKEKHTFRVINNIEHISAGEGLSGDDLQLARIIALFHDIGRFRQFVRYRTFDDEISENHAVLGIKVLNEEGFLTGFDKETIEIIERSILNHNIPKIKETSDNRILLFSRLLRDADKVDIWNLTSTMDIANTIRNEQNTVSYDIPGTIIHCFRNQQVVLLDHAKTMNDFRLLRLSWIYDINFPSTFRLISENNYADKILSRIPDSPALKMIKEIIFDYIRVKTNTQAVLRES